MHTYFSNGHRPQRAGSALFGLSYVNENFFKKQNTEMQQNVLIG